MNNKLEFETLMLLEKITELEKLIQLADEEIEKNKKEIEQLRLNTP